MYFFKNKTPVMLKFPGMLSWVVLAVITVMDAMAPVDAVLPAEVRRLCPRGIKCEGEGFENLLREHMKPLPNCDNGTACPSTIVSIAGVIVNTYTRIPRGLSKETLDDASFDVDFATMHNDPSWCPLDIADGRGPVIIGGIGDSGTRGIAGLFKEGFGYAMCPGKEGCNNAGDNPKFFKMSGKKTLVESGHHLATQVGSTLTDKATLAMLCWGMNSTLSNILLDTPEKVPHKWGWKAPRSVYYVAYFNFLLKGNFRMVHVIRDGRDVSRGDNQMQYHSLCDAGLEEGVTSRTAKCGDSDPKNALHFWANMNRQVYEYGVKQLGPKRYFPLRIEDFVLGPDKEALLARLSFFLGDETLTAAQLEASIGVGLGHEKSYGGGKFSVGERKTLIKTFGSGAAAELKMFGYKLDDYGTEGKPMDLVAFGDGSVKE